MKTIKELFNELKAVEAQLDEWHIKLDAIRKEIMDLVSPIKVGDILVDKNNRRVRVSHILARDFNQERLLKPFAFDYIGTRIRNDGTDGSMVRVYSWDNPVKEEKRPQNLGLILSVVLLFLTVPMLFSGTPVKLTYGYTNSPPEDLAGFIIYMATNSTTYNFSTNVGKATNWTSGPLPDGNTYSFVVTAVSTNKLESEPSNALYWTSPPPALTIVVQTSTNTTSWKNWVTNRVDSTNRFQTNAYYRLWLSGSNPKPALVLPKGQVFVMVTNVSFKLPVTNVVTKLTSPKGATIFK